MSPSRSMRLRSPRRPNLKAALPLNRPSPSLCKVPGTSGLRANLVCLACLGARAVNNTSLHDRSAYTPLGLKRHSSVCPTRADVVLEALRNPRSAVLSAPAKQARLCPQCNCPWLQRLRCNLTRDMLREPQLVNGKSKPGPHGLDRDIHEMKQRVARCPTHNESRFMG